MSQVVADIPQDRAKLWVVEVEPAKNGKPDQWLAHDQRNIEALQSQSSQESARLLASAKDNVATGANTRHEAVIVTSHTAAVATDPSVTNMASPVSRDKK